MQTMADKQKQLSELIVRKTKADAMGPEVIAKAQAMYDDIVRRIRVLEAEIGTGAMLDKPINPCMEVLPLTYALVIANCLDIVPADMDMRYPKLLQGIGQAFERMIAAVQSGDVAAHTEAWAVLGKQSVALAAGLRDYSAAKQLGFVDIDCEVDCYDGKCPSSECPAERRAV